MVAAVGSASWIGWFVDATPGGPWMVRLLEWLTTRQPLFRWRLSPGIGMLGVLAIGYAVLGVAALSGMHVRGSRLEVVAAGCMVAGVAAVAYVLRERE